MSTQRRFADINRSILRQLDERIEREKGTYADAVALVEAWRQGQRRKTLTGHERWGER
jgi:hypothetical protein